MKWKPVLIILLILIVPFVYSAKPTQVFTGDVGIEIKIPLAEFITQNQDAQLNLHIFNLSNGLLMTNETTDCLFHLYNKSGHHILNEEMEFDDNYNDFQLNIGGGNFSQLGFHSFIIQCNESSIGGFVSGSVEVTKTGDSSETNYIVIGLILAVITFIFAFLATKVKHWALQIGLSLFTMVMIIFDFFISARIVEIVDSAQTGMIYYLDTFFKIGVTFFRFALAGTIVFLIYYMYKHIIVNPLKKRREREEEGIYD